MPNIIVSQKRNYETYISRYNCCDKCLLNTGVFPLKLLMKDK